MKNRVKGSAYRPFEDLDRLIHKKSLKLKPDHAQSDPEAIKPLPDAMSEQELFEYEMADVTPLDHKKPKQGAPPFPICSNEVRMPEPDPSEPLARLVRKGEGFEVASTPEYMSGVGFQVHPAVTDYLHKGKFAVQCYIDLHGLNVSQAREAFDSFIQESISHGKRMVLIVHGRGLSSPAEPVLKFRVCRWLTSGQWRKWVMAFSSARACDGGAGATYVLLRQRSLTKRNRKMVRFNRTHRR